MRPPRKLELKKADEDEEDDDDSDRPRGTLATPLALVAAPKPPCASVIEGPSRTVMFMLFPLRWAPPTLVGDPAAVVSVRALLLPLSTPGLVNSTVADVGEGWGLEAVRLKRREADCWSQEEVADPAPPAPPLPPPAPARALVAEAEVPKIRLPALLLLPPAAPPPPPPPPVVVVALRTLALSISSRLLPPRPLRLSKAAAEGGEGERPPSRE